MKNTFNIWLLISLLLLINYGFSQDPFYFGPVCGYEPEDPIQDGDQQLGCTLTSSFWAKANRLQFAPNGLDIFNAHLNIIILQREGEDAGNWTNSETFQTIISNAIEHLNDYYNDLCEIPTSSYDDCFDISLGEPVYIPSINIQFTYDTYFIANDQYWGTYYPNSTLTNYINNGDQWKRGVNIYYTMSATTYHYLVELNQLDPNGIHYNWVNFLPSEQNMNWNQYMVLPNKYAEFIYNLNHGVPLEQLIQQTSIGYSKILRHELGHIFGLGHASISPHYGLNECELSIMHQGSSNACWLPPSEIGEMHRLLHTSNARRYIAADTYFPDLQCQYTINDELYWDYNIRVYSDITIEDGGKLEISCLLHMPKDAKIIVKQGGELIVNGGTITSYDKEMWQGIEVWGNSNASQHPLPGNPCAQGKLIMKNGATIENAVVAVELWKPGDYSTTGGIIDATDSYFRNNVISVHALWYRNFNPADPNSEMDYYGTFTNCSFIIDNDYLGDKTFYKHVDLERVRGLKFYGCDFSLEHDATNVSQWNHAIAAYNAGFHVLPVCTSSIHPCPEYDSCRFKGFDRAIGAFKTTASVYPILINSAQFQALIEPEWNIVAITMCLMPWILWLLMISLMMA